MSNVKTNGKKVNLHFYTNSLNKKVDFLMLYVVLSLERSSSGHPEDNFWDTLYN